MALKFQLTVYHRSRPFFRPAQSLSLFVLVIPWLIRVGYAPWDRQEDNKISLAPSRLSVPKKHPSNKTVDLLSSTLIDSLANK